MKFKVFTQELTYINTYSVFVKHTYERVLKL